MRFLSYIAGVVVWFKFSQDVYGQKGLVSMGGVTNNLSCDQLVNSCNLTFEMQVIKFNSPKEI